MTHFLFIQGGDYMSTFVKVSAELIIRAAHLYQATDPNLQYCSQAIVEFDQLSEQLRVVLVDKNKVIATTEY